MRPTQRIDVIELMAKDLVAAEQRVTDLLGLLRECEAAHQRLKSMTKAVSAANWTPEYRELADAIHMIGRDLYYIGRVEENQLRREELSK